MTLEVNYELGNLPDTFLRWMISQTEGDDRLDASPLAKAIHDALTSEQLRRCKLAAGYDAEPVALTLPLMNYQQACEGFLELTADSNELVQWIEDLDPSKPESGHAARASVEFLKSTALAVGSYAKMIRNSGAPSGSEN